MSSSITDDEIHGGSKTVDVTGGSIDTAEGVNPWASPTDLHHPRASSSQATPQMQPVGYESAQGSLSQPQTADEAAFQLRVLTTPPRTDASVLSEFDPLASDPVEQNAREAWEHAKSHPPPPLITKDSETSINSSRDMLLSPPSSTSHNEGTTSETLARQTTTPARSAPAITTTFPSLVSLARTLTRSPRRSVTPPLPLPPRTSSLQHSHHSSLSGPVPDPALASSPDKPNEAETNTVPAQEDTNAVNSQKQDNQFDFQKFLDQMKSKGADPIAKYLRSFLSNFAKKVFAVNDQIKVIRDFLDFISNKMRTMEGSPWHNSSPQDFDNAMEAMEKLVMNRLYEFTFQPMLPPSQRTTDDLERDYVLHQRISLFGWLREEHLDIPTNQGGREVQGFLIFAQQELLKVNHYKAPRDKLICILNCCKVIFGLIRHLKLPEGADSFIPILIFVVLKANPEHLLSNVEFINRFRNPNKLQSEAGYYLSSLMGAVSFIETMDHSSLSNISQEEFERNVEVAIEELPVTRTPSPPAASTSPNALTRTPRTPSISGTGTPISTPPKLRPLPSPLAGEEAARPLSLPIPSSAPAESSDGSNRRPPDSLQLSLAEDTRRFFQRTSDTISKPLVAIGRIFSDVLDESGLTGAQSGKENERKMGWRDLPGPFAPFSLGSGSGEQEKPQPSIPHWSHPDQLRQHAAQQPPQVSEDSGSYQPPIQTPYKPRIRPTYSSSPSNSHLGSTPGSDHSPTSRVGPLASQPLTVQSPPLYQQSPTLSSQALPPPLLQISPHPSRNPTPTLDIGALQDEIDRAHLAAQDAARDTLLQIFPKVDREVAEMVLEANDGDLGRSIEALLEITREEA